MRQLFFAEQRAEYAVFAPQLAGYLLDTAGVSSLDGVRVLRCTIVESTQPMDTELTGDVFCDRHTEQILSSETVRALCAETFSLCTVPIFRRPSETVAELTLRMLCHDETVSLRQAELYLFSGSLSEEDRSVICRHLVNPASCARISLWENGMLPPEPMGREDSLIPLGGFRGWDGMTLADFTFTHGFRLLLDDMRFIQDYYRVEERREPTLFELRFLDIFWSDHCRHTTFRSALEDLRIDDREISASFEEYLAVREALYGLNPKKVTLMDIATVAGRADGRNSAYGGSEPLENNAFSYTVPVTVHHPDGSESTEPWLLHVKNESHN